MENAKKMVEVESVEVDNTKSKLWNLNFILLWQGQLVSSFGDSVYDIALGFWILAETGSTAIMGLLMAASVAPRIFLSPIAGTYVDRHDRKRILVITDGIRGLTITFIGIAALLGFIKVWMVLVGGIVLGVCGSFFNPAVQSSLPDIVHKEKLVKGNSAISLASSGMDIVGKSAGGFLYQVIGAPLLFLTNGISFLISAVSESYIKIPTVYKETSKTNFIEDLKDGFNYVKGFTGLKYLYVTIAFLNFFAVMGLVLLLPYFSAKTYLGPERYGVAMAFSTGGLFLGFLLLSTIDINKFKKSILFTSGGMISGLSMGVLPFVSDYYIIIGLLFINGFTVAVVRTILQSSMQASVSQDMMGKVFGFRRAISSSLVPMSMAFGGLLAEFIPIEYIISGGYCIIFILFLVLAFSKPVSELIDTF